MTQTEQENNTLLHEDPIFEKGFTIISNKVLYAKNLSAQSKTLYILLLSFSWNSKDHCFPGLDKLCCLMGYSEKIVRGYLKELETVNLLSVRRRGLGKTNLYTLLSISNAKLEEVSTNQERDTSPDQEPNTYPVQEQYPSPDKEDEAFKKTKIEEDEILTPPIVPQDKPVVVSVKVQDPDKVLSGEEYEEYLFFISKFNEVMEKRYKGDKKCKKNFKDLYKQGYTHEDIELSITNIKKSLYHLKGGYITPEFITRPDKFSKWLNATDDEIATQNEKYKRDHSAVRSGYKQTRVSGFTQSIDYSIYDNPKK